MKGRAKWLGSEVVLFILAVLVMPAALLQIATLQTVPVANVLVYFMNKIDGEWSRL